MVAIQILSVLTVIGQICIIALLLVLVFRRFANARAFFQRYALWGSLIVAVIATGGSLYFSQALHFVPCELCWLQRIFMYPLMIILIVALITKTRDYRKYVIPMSIIGAIISAYHYSTQVLLVPSFCSIADPNACYRYPFISYGYITIPLMAFTAFIIIILVNSVKKPLPSKD
jgi:disulfide bond formation protein DsbB